MPPKRSPRDETMKTPILVDKEDDIKEGKGEGIIALNGKRRRQEASAFLMDIELSEGT